MNKDRSVDFVFKKLLTKIVCSVESNCLVFAQHLEMKGIVKRHTSERILNTRGLSEYEQASELVNQARRKLENYYPQYPELFQKFVTCLDELDSDLAHEVLELHKGKLLRYVYGVCRSIHVLY